MARIGLVAGEGKLPIVFARVAKERGDTVVAFGLKGLTDAGLESHVHKMHWLEWGRLKKALLLLATERIGKIILLGKLKKETLFEGGEKLDDDAKRLLKKIDDKKDYAILNEVGRALNKIGVEVLDATTYLKDLIPLKSSLTKREPTNGEWEDINYGKDVARHLAGLDIGQTVIVKDRTVIAVEAMEGTDRTISRAGALVNGPFVVVKVARPGQDMRFDVPLIGLDTLNAMIKAGGRVLALEEKKTLMMDKGEMTRLADEKGISIVVIAA